MNAATILERYYTSALVTTKSAVAKTTMCKPRKNSRSHAKPYTLTRSGWSRKTPSAASRARNAAAA